MPNAPSSYAAGPAVANPVAADIDLASHRLKSLPAPQADTDAARVRDVPEVVARAMTITGLSSYTATATVIEANSVGALPVDGLTPAVGEVVVVNVNSNLSAHVDNGIYTVTVVGDGSHKLKLTRDPRFTAAGSIYAGLTVRLVEGSSLGGAVGVPVTVATTGAITPGTTAFAWNLPVVANPLIATLNANSKTITAAVLTSSAIGSSSTRTTYDGATKVLSTDKSANFTAAPTVARYTLTADTLTITIDESTWANGDTVEFWSTTETTAPAHTFQCSSTGKFKYAGSGGGGSGASTAPWPSGATCVVITRYASGVYLRS